MEQSNEIAQTTNFVDDASTEQTTIRSTMPCNDSTCQLVDDNSVRDFLGRPQIVAAGQLNTSSTANSVVTSFRVATTMEAQQIWYRKLAGYRYVRGTVHVKLVINANPFQQGRWLLHFLPCEYDYSNVSSHYVAAHNSNLCNKTQQPNVEISTTQTSVELSAPYVTPATFYDRTHGDFDWGTFYLSVLSPLVVGAASPTTVDYTFFMWFTDVELSGPIYGPESGSVSREKKFVRSTSTIAPFVGEVSKAVGLFSDVPIIGNSAKALSLVGSAFANTLSLFGWAKPVSDKTQMLVTVNPSRNMINADGENCGEVFALNHTGSVPVMPEFAGTKLDEMSFAYLKRIPAYFAAFSWADSSLTDAVLYDLTVGPQNIYDGGFTATSGGAGVSWKAAPPFAHISRMFRYYRGGIKLTFKFVKTQFHSGRVAISFWTNFASVTLNQSSYVLREVVDIREMEEFTVVIPYIQHTHYLKCDFDGEEADSEASLGRLQVRVVNELRAPETCSQSIKVLVYASAADDYELATPINYKQPTFMCESGGAIGNADIVDSDVINNNAAIGDPFVSVKQLLTTFRQVLVGPSFARTAAPYTTDVYPFTINALNKNFSTGSEFNIWGDYISELSTGYVLSRGGVRWAVYRGSGAYSIDARLNNNIAPSGVTVITTGSTLTTSSYQLPTATFGGIGILPMRFTRNFEWGIDVTVPHNQRTPSRLNYVTTSVPEAPDVYRCMLRLETRPMTSNVYATYNPLESMFRAGNDDLCLGYFIGFPPYVSGYTVPP